MVQVTKQVNRREVMRSSKSVVDVINHENLINMPLDVHHIISNSRRNPINIYTFVNERHDGQLDPTKKVMFMYHTLTPKLILTTQGFIPKLQDHLLARLLHRNFNGDEHDDFTDEDRNYIHISGNTLYSVQLLRVNYTTYDIRRASDTINPRTHNYVMVHSPETGENAHQFWYAQVIGIFHAVVRHTGPRSHNSHMDHSIEFLWVRWLGVEPGHRFGRRLAKLPMLGFVPNTDPYAFGFLDPSLVIRGAHIIPTFVAGQTSELLVQRSMTLGLNEDWVNFYVNM